MATAIALPPPLNASRYTSSPQQDIAAFLRQHPWLCPYSKRPTRHCSLPSPKSPVSIWPSRMIQTTSREIISSTALW